MKGNFDTALNYVLKHEGGFVNHPKDPGGMTNLGVTKKAWETWVGHPVTEAEMRALTPGEVSSFYKLKYWEMVRGDDLPYGVDYVVFDCAVNSGPGRAAKFLQEVVKVKADGAIGPGTLKAVSEMHPADIVSAYNIRRLDFLQALPTWETFGKGWGRRVAEVKTTAEAMVA